MVRWTRPADYEPVMRLLQQVRPGVTQFECNLLVDQVEDVIRGVVGFILGKPDTLIRFLSVAPGQEVQPTIEALLNAVRLLAAAHGSLTIEGTVPPEWDDLLDLVGKAGASAVPCVRVRLAP
jgi:hypothetical protein